MRNRERGVTAIGWLFLLTPFAIVGYAGIRLAPLYLNYMKVVRALDQAASDFKSGGDSQSLRVAVDRHFEVDMVDFPTTKDMKVTREGNGWLLEMQYDDEAPLFSNIALHVSFDKTAHAAGGGG